jgi:hypothetical protein
MELQVMAIYQQYHTTIVCRRQSFLLHLTLNNKSVLVIYLEDYLRNTMTHSTNILVYSSDT